MAPASPDTSGWPTRELILLHASRLFAGRGFLGTSTRDIAAAVGIRQPSVYSHFSSKQEIAEELLRRDLTAGIEALQRLTGEGGGTAVELYRYLLWEVTYVRSTPFDLRALYLGEILDLPEFEEGRRLNALYEQLLVDIIGRGVAGGEFVATDPAFALRAVDAIILEAIRGAADRRQHGILDEPDMAATFVVRALLRTPSQLPRVRAAAHRADRTSAQAGA
jgi:AcrR family transcriptional regulator